LSLMLSYFRNRLTSGFSSRNFNVESRRRQIVLKLVSTIFKFTTGLLLIPSALEA